MNIKVLQVTITVHRPDANIDSDVAPISPMRFFLGLTFLEVIALDLPSDILTLASFPCFATLTSGGRGWCDPLPCVLKLSVIEFSGKKQQIALNDYS